MNAAEAAEYLGVGIDMLARFEKEGLVTHRLGTGPKAQRRWYRADLDAFVTRVSRNRCSPEPAGQGDGTAA
jgi:DNA-binding transcriptional MerR regulator